MEQLISVSGALYSELLSDKGQWAATRQRGRKSLEIAKQSARILDVSLSNLTVGKANLGLAFKYGPTRKSDHSASQDLSEAYSAIARSIDGFQRYGNCSYIPNGVLTRAAFYRGIGNWFGAARDLDEVEELAEPGPMRLHLCDMALERARLAFARSEAFAPLNGLIDDSPPEPEPPGAAARKSLHDDAAKQLAIAADYIETCGYHRRDEELAELQAVLRGERSFASLPPRV
jgi:hypothetical protein